MSVELPIVAVINHKGGVGKTTTAVSLASAMAAAGKEVLLIDMDPQGNAAGGLGVDMTKVDRGTHELILGEGTAEDLKIATVIPRLSLIPATFGLSSLSMVSDGDEDPEFWLAESLREAPPLADVVVLDCPPSFGVLSVNALVAAQNVIVPVQCESYALTGLKQIIASIEQIIEEAEHPIEYAILLTMIDQTRKLDNLVAREVRAHFGERVFETYIPSEPKIGEAAFLGNPVIIHDRHCAGSQSYVAAAMEAIAWLDGEDDIKTTLSKYGRVVKESLSAWEREGRHRPEAHPQPEPHLDGGQVATVEEANDYQNMIRKSLIGALALTAGAALALMGVF